MKQSLLQSFTLALALTAVHCAVPATGLAQESAVLEEIVVTAQRREQPIQDVPITIVAVSGDALKAGAINNTYDLQARIPGFVSTPVASFNFNYLRGVGTDQQTVGLEPAVATHIDGVYLPRVASGFQELYDVDRVEVVKGPQGTLFGRNATGGIIHVITNRPANAFGGYVDATLGNFDKRRIEAALNVPLVDNQVSFRIAAVVHEDSGYSENEYLGIDEDHTDFAGARAQLHFDISERIDLRIFGDVARNNGGRGAASHPSDPLSDNLALGIPGGEINSDPRVNRRDAPAITTINDLGIGVELNWDFEDVALTSLTSYRELENTSNVDFDLTPLNFSGFSDPFEESKNWVQEFQLSSISDNRFQWVAGVFLFRENVVQDYRFPFATSVFAGNAAGPAIGQGGFYDAGTSDVSEVDTAAQAIFAQGNYAFNDRWSSTFGVRLSQETRSIDYDVVLLNIPVPATALDLIENPPALGAAFVSDSQEQDWDALTPRIGIEFTPNERVLWFLSATRGFKAGGYNGILFGAATELEAVDPEFLWSYEGGVKATLADGQMRLNASAFSYDYTDIQLNILTDEQSMTRGFANVRNAGDATIAGLELEWHYSVSEELEISALLATLDSALDYLVAADPNDATNTVQTGNPLPNSPDFTGSLSAQYTSQFGGGGTLSMRADYSTRAKRYHSVFRDFYNSSASYQSVNARVAYTSAGGRWTLGIYGRNLADEEIQSFGFRAPFFGALKLYGERRNFGVNLRYQF